MTDGPAAGWYPDPLRRFDHRYWDGSAWTHHVSRGGQATVDEAPAAGGRATAATTTATEAGRQDATSTVRPAESRSTSTETGQVQDEASADTGDATAGADFAAVGASPEQAAATAPGETASPSPSPRPTVPGTPGGWRPDARTATTNSKAVASLIASIVWLGGLGSLVGIVLGLMGRREVERSSGRETGAGIAMAGIVIGALGILATIAVAAIVSLVMRAVGGGAFDDVFPADVTVDGSSDDAQSDLAYSLVDVGLHQDLVLEERGRYAQSVDELMLVGWIVSPSVDVEVFADGADGWCVQATSHKDPTLVWATSSDDADGPGAGSC